MTHQPGYRTILVQWIPLALSWVMMSIASPIVSAGISRLPDPAVNLAAYGLTMDIAVLVESPIIMILSASVALVRGRSSYLLLRRFVWRLSIALTLLGILVYFTPLYDVVFLRILGVPPAVAQAARPALQVLIFWPFAIGWRRLFHGILITHGRTRLVSAGTMWRLGTLTIGVVVGMRLGLPGALVGGIALAASVIVETAVITYWTLPLIRTRVMTVDDRPPTADREALSPEDNRRPSAVGGRRSITTESALWRFYVPLAATDMMRVVSRPVSVAGIARAAQSTLSLAAWPPALGLAGLMSSSVMALQEVVLAQLSGGADQRRLRNFSLGVGALFTSLQALLSFTPLADWYFHTIMGLPPEVQALAVPAAQILTPLPLLFAARNYGRGVLIARHKSQGVQWAMTANLVALILLLIIGVWLGSGTGVFLAAWATVGAQALEVAILAWLGRTQAEHEELPAPSPLGRGVG